MAAVTLFKKNGEKTTCLVCQHRCQLKLNQVGFCQVRKNIDGKIIPLTGNLLSGPPQADPVEKKPLYHFLPGTETLSIGSFGCNFRCKKCLNWWCSWGEPATTILKSLASGQTLPGRAYQLEPEKIVERCLQAGLLSLSFTYNEPIVNPEFIRKTAKLAQKKGLKTILVTNGSWTKNTIDYLGTCLDAANIDFKSFSEETAGKIGSFFKKIPEMSLYAQKKYKIHLELTTVLIPTINDSAKELEKMTAWIVKNLGSETPWHISAFSPRLAPVKDFQEIPAPTEKKLEKAVQIGIKSGLKHVYVWAPGSGFSQGETFCPVCGEKVVTRIDWHPMIVGLNKKAKCQKCRHQLNFKLK